MIRKNQRVCTLTFKKLLKQEIRCLSQFLVLESVKECLSKVTL